MSDSTESGYRAGCERWMAGDLDEAARRFDLALAESSGPGADGWWFACSRARAQVAMAMGDLDVAAVHLSRVPEDLVGAAQTMVLRARLAHLHGAADEAALGVSNAVVRLDLDHEDDLASLMNGAIALAGAAELLVDLGYGEDARRLLDRALDRVHRAGVDDPAVDASLTLVAAGSARLTGELAAANRLLASVDTSLSADLQVRTMLERARLAAAEGDIDAATRSYAEAASLAVAAGDRSLARLVEMEQDAGPAATRVEAVPVERWRELRMGGSDVPTGEQPTYAVVVSLAVDRDPDAFLALDHDVSALLAADPDLGLVDGHGTDGEVFQLFLDGDDATALWGAVQPLVTAFRPSAGSKVVITPFDADPVELDLASG